MAWTSPRTWVAGEKPSASTLNTHIRDNFKAIGDPWTAYTPTLTNVTLGNGTLAAASIQAGKLTVFRIKITFGSTTAVTGSIQASLPVAATGTRTVNALVQMYDSSVPTYVGGWAFNSSTTTLLLRDNTLAVVNATAPFTWATGDELLITGTYEAA